MRANDHFLVNPPSVRTRSSDSPVLMHPALHRRDVLRERRPRAVLGLGGYTTMRWVTV